jgi:hypothetical protein
MLVISITGSYKVWAKEGQILLYYSYYEYSALVVSKRLLSLLDGEIVVF